MNNFKKLVSLALIPLAISLPFFAMSAKLEKVTKENKLVQKIQKMQFKYKNITAFDNLSLEDKIEIFKFRKEIVKYLGYDVFSSNNKDGISSRAWSEWWGANLWVNLDKFETKSWINLTSKIFPFAHIRSIIGNLVESGADLVAESAGNSGLDKVEEVAKLIQLLAKAGLFLNDYVNATHLRKLANESAKGIISYRFTFGFIPSGVFPDYAKK